jgi:hypothetical protein
VVHILHKPPFTDHSLYISDAVSVIDSFKLTPNTSRICAFLLLGDAIFQN